MNELFELPVIYKEQQLHFDTHLMQEGYIHKFQVLIEGHEVIFEPDEESNYRAIFDPLQFDKMTWDIDLIKAIAKALSDL